MNKELITYFDHYLTRIEQKFKSEKNIQETLKTLKFATHIAISKFACTPVLLEEGSDVAGVLLMKSEKSNLQFGFCIFPENGELFNAVWKQVKNELISSGKSTIKGPIQGTTFFPYQLILESDKSIPLFKGEYPSHPNETHFLESLNPSKRTFYNSGVRNNFDEVIAVSKSFYESWKSKGLEIKTIDLINKETLRSLIPVVNEAFLGNWSFGKINEDQFLQLFAKEMKQPGKLKLQTAILNNELIGFCRFVEEDSNTIIVKTIALKPEFQKMGIGNAMAYAMHTAIKDCGYSTAYYAQIFEGNRVNNMPKDTARFFRRYVTYEFCID